MFNHPLMSNNFKRKDFDGVIKLLKSKDPILTSSVNVVDFEKKWSKWLGIKYSVFVNSGSSANFLTIAALKIFNKSKKNEIIVPSLTWISDVVSIINHNFKPIFVDINLNNLGAKEDEIIKKINKNTLAVFLTHAQGFNALSKKLISILKKNKIHLIEDVCESHGATFNNKKLGTFGLASNFSFYYAHHMSTIEGGMVSTNNQKIYEILRVLRSHGMAREFKNKNLEKRYIKNFKHLSPKFIFLYPGYNFRNNEIGALIGISQLKSLTKNSKKRANNLRIFLKSLDPNKYVTNYDLKGNSNYAFPVILKTQNFKKRDKFEKILIKNNIEFRRGNAGGGNQIRQPYLKNYTKGLKIKNFKNVEIVHHFGYYIGNFPELSKEKITKISNILNSVNI